MNENNTRSSVGGPRICQSICQVPPSAQYEGWAFRPKNGRLPRTWVF